MSGGLSQAPVLSTPETHIFEDPTPPSATQNTPRYTDEELHDVYEVERTTREIRNGGYKRVALQFPDHMLRDGPRVFDMLEQEMKKLPAKVSESQHRTVLETNLNELEITSNTTDAQTQNLAPARIRFYILGDTSYGSCCVDEIAAEHANADVVVHYGRSCLSPTARLPVIYVFTSNPLSIADVTTSFETNFPSKEEKVVLMADITYHSHITALQATLQENGYTNILAPEVVHDPSSQIPNRRIAANILLTDYTLFHISDPPPALLLTLSSRLKSLSIYPTTTSEPNQTIQANTSLSLRRRYALLTRLTTVPILGILVNTLSVAHYLPTITSLKRLISLSNKKSYTFVVGKINAAKIANFSEIGGWVVVGCWESSLVESFEGGGGGGFYRPVVTPFELGLALAGDEKRVWDGSWRGDFGGVETLVKELEKEKEDEEGKRIKEEEERLEVDGENNADENENSEEESSPPEFDLRTGRYVSHSRPMRTTSSYLPSNSTSATQTTPAANALTRRAKGDLATINGAVSPGAEYLKSQRTWTGLGSDFAEEEAPEGIEEGRGGIARGYRVGDGEMR